MLPHPWVACAHESFGSFLSSFLNLFVDRLIFWNILIGHGDYEFPIGLIDWGLRPLDLVEDDLWAFELPDGRGLEKGMSFLYPYIEDKSSWPYQEDVLYWDEWPVRHPSLLFAAVNYSDARYLELWKSLEADPKTPEVLRNLPLRYPLLWVRSP